MEPNGVIYQALIADNALTTLVGNDSTGQPRIYGSWHNSNRGYPQITINNSGEAVAWAGDNIVRQVGAVIEVNIWTQDDPEALKTEVRRVISSLLTATFPLVVRESFEDTAEAYRVLMNTNVYF